MVADWRSTDHDVFLPLPMMTLPRRLRLLRLPPPCYSNNCTDDARVRRLSA
jgi:hypothetical protein